MSGARKFDFLRCDLCGGRESTPRPGSHPGKRVCGWCFRATVTDEALLKNYRRGIVKTASGYLMPFWRHNFCGQGWGSTRRSNRCVHYCLEEIARRVVLGILHAVGAPETAIVRTRNLREDFYRMRGADGCILPEYRFERGNSIKDRI